MRHDVIDFNHLLEEAVQAADNKAIGKLSSCSQVARVSLGCVGYFIFFKLA